MMELIGQINPTGLNTARFRIRRCRNTNSSFSFWWLYYQLHTGATEEYDGSTWTASSWKFKHTARKNLRRSRNTNSSFSFWWLYLQVLYRSNRRI
jgi:hypothetical protein